MAKTLIERLFGLEEEKRVRSPLQQALEREGWTFLGNELIDPSLIGITWGIYDTEMLLVPHIRTDEEIMASYVPERYRALQVTDAFDVRGHSCPQMRAVYGKN